MLKVAKAQSGSSWNEKRSMVIESPHMWDNLEISFPKIKKFCNGKLSFLLVDSCVELYDDQVAEGKYNCTSLESAEAEEPLINVQDDIEELDDVLVLDEEVQTQKIDAVVVSVERNDHLLSKDEEVETTASAERRAPQVRSTGASSQLKEAKKGKKNSNIESMMERYLEMRTKQAKDGSANLAKEKKQTQGVDYSVKKCIFVFYSMDVTKEKKMKTYAVFKKQDNREIFLCTSEDDLEAAFIWLRSEMV